MRHLHLLIALFLFSLPQVVSAQPLPTVEAVSGQTIAVTANLSEGDYITDLSWAWSSNNACFVESRRDKFTGKHFLFKTEIPRYSTMLIRVIPADRSTEMSLYAYSGGGGAVPPALPSCVSCEADFKLERNSVHGRNRPAFVREVELRAVNRPYPVTIGVVGANGLSAGDFNVEIEIIPRQ